MSGDERLHIVIEVFHFFTAASFLN